MLATITFTLAVDQLWATKAAHAGGLDDVVRGMMRPEISTRDAVVALMDASSTLREIEALAVTGKDSQERFEARRLWPAFAKTLREVGPAGPVVAALLTTGDKEATLSAQYGGKAGSQPGAADPVYIALGRVLTISGRTIRNEAQASPEPAQEARKALEGLLAQVPKAALDEATAFRIERAAAAARK